MTQQRGVTAGVFKAAGVVALLAGSAIAAPLNDNRSGAITVLMGSTQVGSLTGDTTFEPGSVASSCAGANLPDIWYRVNAPAGTWRVDICGATFDSAIQVFANSNGTPGASVACATNTCGASGLGTRVDVVNNTSSGNYWIRLAARNGTSGTFSLAVTFVSAPPAPPVEIPTPNLGPDVTIGGLSDVSSYGTLVRDGITYQGFAVGTDSWNIGDRPAAWISSNNLHPVIGQSMYRLKNGRFEQIGVSWLKHGFLSLNSQTYSQNMNWPSATNRSCTTPPQFGAQLGVNCSDLYGSGLNGSRSYLGPRFDVNAINGVFTYPWQPLVNNFTPTESDPISRRIMVPQSLMGDTTARYFVEGHYVTQDDAQWNNGRNNLSYREVQPNGTTFIGNTVRRKVALEAWPVIDPTVTLVPADFTEIVTQMNDTVAVPPVLRTINVQGRFWVASKVTNNGNGTWDYEYAVMNVNSHRSMNRFALPGGGMPMTNVGFFGGKHHSGDRVNNDAWIPGTGTGFKCWDTDMEFPSTMTIPGAPAASATVSGVGAGWLRWGMMNNYRFTSTAAPTTGFVRLGLARPPAATTGFQGSILNVPGLQVPTACKADIAGANQAVGGDGQLTADDIIVYLNAYFAGDMWGADVAGQNQGSLPDNELTADDIFVFLNSFFAGC
ncbi:MAG: hypothetical protein MUE97_03530 [Phycisphaerales bacterium]|jgi:hypothetical protein|nr:hypothetical protein [Phycisphaerales bacterium]